MAPTKEKYGLTFYPIPEFSEPEIVFGAKKEAFFKRDELPKIPDGFTDLVNHLFFEGGYLPKLAPQIDKIKASRAVHAWLSSFAPAHESKVATVAYAFWLWSDENALNS